MRKTKDPLTEDIESVDNSSTFEGLAFADTADLSKKLPDQSAFRSIPDFVLMLHPNNVEWDTTIKRFIPLVTKHNIIPGINGVKEKNRNDLKDFLSNINRKGHLQQVPYDVMQHKYKNVKTYKLEHSVTYPNGDTLTGYMPLWNTVVTTDDFQTVITAPNTGSVPGLDDSSVQARHLSSFVLQTDIKKRILFLSCVKERMLANGLNVNDAASKIKDVELLLNRTLSKESNAKVQKRISELTEKINSMKAAFLVQFGKDYNAFVSGKTSVAVDADQINALQDLF